jgi:hypothetical protein
VNKDIEAVIRKLDRVHEHLTALDEMRKAFIDPRPYRTELKGEEDGCQQVFIVSQVISTIPDQFGILVGECLYHLRSSLDYMTLLTIPKHQRLTLEKQSQFPIVTNVEQTFGPFAKRHLQGVPESVQSVMRELQPFEPNGVITLFALETLSNVDKHRRPAIAGAAVAGMQRSVPRDEIEPVKWTFGFGPLVLGSEVARAVVPVGQAHTKVDADFNYEIMFYEPGAIGTYVVHGLQMMRERIKNRVLPAILP